MAADGKHSTAATKAITQHQDENERELFAVFFCKELLFFFFCTISNISEGTVLKENALNFLSLHTSMFTLNCKAKLHKIRRGGAQWPHLTMNNGCKRGESLHGNSHIYKDHQSSINR